jgi:hypothetical protein
VTDDSLTVGLLPRDARYLPRVETGETYESTESINSVQ